MNFQDYFELQLEARHALEFLTDPENEGKYEYDVFANNPEVTRHGEGVFGKVISKPSWNYVLKIFSETDHCYIRFIRAASRSDNPLFPKVYGPPQRIIPNFNRNMSSTKNYMYFVRLEKLYPIADELSNQLLDGRFRDATEMHAASIAKGEPMPSAYQEVLDRAYEKYPEIKPLFDALEQFHSNPNWNGCRLDLHGYNVMRRQNGDLVITDPFASNDHPKQSSYRQDQEQKVAKLYRNTQNTSLPPGKTINDLYRKLPKKVRDKKEEPRYW